MAVDMFPITPLAYVFVEENENIPGRKRENRTKSIYNSTTETKTLLKP